MNQGIFGFPSALGGSVLRTTEIDVSGTYLIASGTTRLVIFAVGGGGGGGAGGKRASGTALSGGAAGSGGGQIYQDFNVEDLGGVNTTLAIAIGAGGVAGATAGDTAGGGIGGTGGTTTITPTGKPGLLISCIGGEGGGGAVLTGFGSSSGSNRTGFSYGATLTHITGGGSSRSTGVPAAVPVISINNHGGVGGAGLAATPVAIAGCAIQVIQTTTTSVVSPEIARSAAVGVIYSGGTDTVAPVNSYLHILGKMSPGFGGAGGGSGTTGATKGGNGYRGSGGGGGGSTLNTFTSGGGGTGGNGYVCIVAIG